MSNILGWLVVILGGGFSLIICLYMIVSLIVMIAYKIYRKVRFRASCERFVVGSLQIIFTKNHVRFTSFTFVVDEAVVVCYNVFR